MRQPYILVGLFRSASSLGETARRQYEAMQRAGLNVYAYDISARFRQTDMLAPTGFRFTENWPKEATLIIHLNAPELPFALAYMGRARTHGRTIIGYWAWELERVPRDWLPCFKYVHEIWTCSNFVTAALKKETDKPVKTVHYVLPPPRPTPQCPALFADIPADTFVATALLNADSSLTRKNPFGIIEAFKRAFGEDDNALLLLRIGRLNTHNRAGQDILRAIGQAKNIRLVQDVLDDDARDYLLRRANVLLALHRSEGFGLVMVEAMDRGTAVIATGWSGNMDFMDEQSARLVPYSMVPVTDPYGIYAFPDQQWAEPDITAAATQLRALKDDPAAATELCARARAHIRGLLTLDHFKKQTELG